MARAAIDMEGVVANIHSPTINEYDRRNGTSTREMDILTWEFGGVTMTTEDFLEISGELWQLRGQGYVPIPAYTGPLGPMFEKLSYATDYDIVTARPEKYHNEMLQWLEDFNVLHGDAQLIHEQEKHALDEYDVYVDDNPNLIGEVDSLVLVLRPWNMNVRVDNTVTLADDLEKALDVVINGEWQG